MEEPISDMAWRIQTACSTIDSTIFRDAAYDVEEVQAALVQAQLSLADASLFDLGRLKTYVTVSHDCKMNLIELQHLIDYYSRPGLASIRTNGVQLTLDHLRSQLQACINDLSAMDVPDIQGKGEEGNNAPVLWVPTIHISSPELPAETIHKQMAPEKTLPTVPVHDTHHLTLLDTAAHPDWDATQATDVQRWSQSSFFQISLETVLEEFDDTRFDSGTSTTSRSSYSSRSSCSERTVTPPPMYAREAGSREYRASVEIMSDVTDSYIQHAYYGEPEFSSADSHDTLPVSKLSPSYKGVQPHLDQYSPSFQLKKRSDSKLELSKFPSAQPTLSNQSLVNAQTSSSLIARRRPRRDAQQTGNKVNSPCATKDHTAQQSQKQEEVAIDMSTDFDWLEEELALAENSPIVHPASVNPVERRCTPFVHPRTKHMSVAHCNSQSRNQSVPLSPSPLFDAVPSQRHNSLPINSIGTSTNLGAQSEAILVESDVLYPSSRSQRCQSTNLAHLPLRNNLFSQSVPNLHSSTSTSHRISNLSNPPTRPPPPPPLPSWMNTTSMDDTTQDIHISNSKPVFMESLRGLRISFQPPQSVVKSRKSFQRLSSMFHKPRQADSFFDHSD